MPPVIEEELCVHNSSIVERNVLVDVFPWLPATANAVYVRISIASISERCLINKLFSLQYENSSFSGLIAELTTKLINLLVNFEVTNSIFCRT